MFFPRVLAASVLLACVVPAQAAALQLEAQALSSALYRLATQAGIQILFDARVVAGRSAPAVTAERAEDALSALLQGGDLTYRQSAPGTYLIVAATPTRLPTVQVVGSLSNPDAVDGENSYARTRASTATKTDTPIMETPMTIQVIPKQALQDLGLTSTGLSDVLAYQGVQTLGFAPSTEFFVFRGFTTSTSLWNGIRIEEFFTSNGPGNGGVWIDNVERVEVLKGPSSILYGRAEPGGAVNVITRKPQGEFGGEVRAGVGSWAERWLGLDITGPVDTAGTLRYRVNVADETSDSYYRNGSEYASRGIAPALAWRVSEDTTLAFEGQYRDLRSNSYQSYVPIDPGTGRPIEVDRKQTLPPDNLGKFSQQRNLLSLDHRFSDRWAVNWKVMHHEVDNPVNRQIFYNTPVFPVLPGDLLTVSRAIIASATDSRTQATTFDLTGKIEAFGIRHTLLAGADYYNYRYRDAVDQVFGSNAYDTDYYNPTRIDFSTLSSDPFYFGYTTEIDRRASAIYLQDQMALPGNWHLLLGARYQRLEETTNYLTVATYKTRVVQPRVGLLWRPQPWISAYYNYSENIGAGNGFNVAGDALDPESSKQHEVGVKTEWMGGKLAASLALFDITKYDLATEDPANPGFNIGIGEVESKGYELNLQGALTENWKIMLNYTHARPVVKVGTSPTNTQQGLFLNAGDLLPYVSNRTFSALTRYRLPGEMFKGWTLGGGVQWASATNPDSGTTLPTRPYTRYTIASAFASYETELGGYATTVQLNVDNLFDEEYFRQFGQGSDVIAGNYGEPRQARLSLRMAF